MLRQPVSNVGTDGSVRSWRTWSRSADDQLPALDAVKVAVRAAGAGVLQGALAVHLLDADVELDQLRPVILGGVARVDDGARHVDGHAADGVDRRPEALEVEQPEVIDLDAEVLLDGLLQQPDAAARLLELLAVDVDGVDPILAVARDIDQQVARIEIRLTLGSQIDLADHDGIGAGDLAVVALVHAERDEGESAGRPTTAVGSG